MQYKTAKQELRNVVSGGNAVAETLSSDQECLSIQPDKTLVKYEFNELPLVLYSSRRTSADFTYLLSDSLHVF